eukprot:30044-Prymnesium_polylepis.2
MMRRMHRVAGALFVWVHESSSTSDLCIDIRACIRAAAGRERLSGAPAVSEGQVSEGAAARTLASRLVGGLSQKASRHRRGRVGAL